MTDFITKDSGKREEYASGMRRDTQEGKPRFELMLPDTVPYEEQMLTRFASLLARGAEKYGDRNWELAESEDEMRRFKGSAFRHFIQWFCGETDEDHAAAVMFNIMAHETTGAKVAIAQREEAESPTLRLGGRARVLGDSADWCHGYAEGTIVRLTDAYEYEGVRGFECVDAENIDWYVAAQDLEVVSL